MAEAPDFSRRFGGVARNISFPVGNVVAIYAKENGAGMAFEVDGDGEMADEIVVAAADADSAPDEPPTEPPRPDAGRPKLQRIKWGRLLAALHQKREIPDRDFPFSLPSP